MAEAGDRRRKVLVVDDEPLHREIIIAALEGKGVQVLEAGDADSAVEIARRERPYLVFLDLQLERGRKDGLRVVKSLKQEDAQLRVVAYTAWVIPEFRQQALDAGCDEFLAKPVELTRLREVTARYLNAVDEQSHRPSAGSGRGELVEPRPEPGESPKEAGGSGCEESPET